MIHVCHKITLSYPQRRCPLAYHKGMWGREAWRRLFRYVFEAVGLQRVRSLSPSEEKHWSTIWSETSSSVDGLHFGLWSLSTSTGNTQRVRIKRKKYEWTAPLISSSRHVRLLSPCSAVTYRLLRPHRSRSLSAKQQKQSHKKTPNMVTTRVKCPEMKLTDVDHFSVGCASVGFVTMQAWLSRYSITNTSARLRVAPSFSCL